MDSKRSRNFFSIGSKVEVTTKEEGFVGSWYTATIINPPYKKPTKNHFWVEYDILVTEEDNAKPLIERVHFSNVRPIPQRCLTDHKDVLNVNDVVEACYRDGWWCGVIVKFVEDGGGGGGGGGELRRKYLVAFDCPYEEIVFCRHELRLHLNWVNGKWVRPRLKKEVRFSSKNTSESNQEFRLESVLTKVSTPKRLRAPTKKFKNTSTDSKDLKSSKKLKRENASQAPPVFTPCEFNSVSTKESSGKADLVLVSTEKGERNVNCTLESLERHKHSGTSLSPMKNLDCSEENAGKSQGRSEDDAGKSHQRTKMGRLKKKLLQRFLISLQSDESTVEGELVHDNAVQVPASEAELSEATGNSSAGARKPPYGELSAVSEMDNGIHELETAIDKRVIAGTISTSEQSQSWPFIKSSGVWKTVDSMDIFTRMPQTPHFSPLNQYEESSREKLALCMMMKFAYETDRITGLSLDDLKNTSIINEILVSLKELESHGFDFMDLKHKLQQNELLGKLEEVKSTIRKRETEKTAAETEITELFEQMKSLEEKLESAKMTKSLKEQELATLESAKGVVSGKIQSLELEFQRITASLW